jgi:mevalonate kinase
LTTAYAPGKVILFGEHAVVYGRPAIAVPVMQVRACAVVEDGPAGQGVLIHAVDLHLYRRVGDPIPVGSPAYPLGATVRNALRRLGI